MMKLIATLMAAFLLNACALPETTVKTGSPRPKLAVQGAPDGAELIVDGLSMGAANRFSGKPNVLIVEDGVHQVEVKSAGSIIHSEKVFISSGETKVITVNSGAPR